MPPSVDAELLDMLACPDCRGGLREDADSLNCAQCGLVFSVDSGTPLLYPSSMDMMHLEGEQHLAEPYEGPTETPKERFRREQWLRAKDEFWALVESHAARSPGKIVNIGCGLDTGFSIVDQTRNLCVWMDIVLEVLNKLKTSGYAKHLVAGDVTALPFKEASFDCVVCADVIHHVSDQVPNVLKSFSDLLKPGGTLFLQDPNAWGMIQIPKSILLPKAVHGKMRSLYHKLKRSSSKPADYEFSTSAWAVARCLRELGFVDLQFHEHNSYPNISPAAFSLYKIFARSSYVRTYHNYHYTIRATKG